MPNYILFIRAIRVRYLSGILIFALASGVVIFALTQANSYRRSVDAFGSDLVRLVRDLKAATSFAEQTTRVWSSATRDDLVRRAVIMAIMCQGRVDFESIELAHLIRMHDYFAPELERLAPMVDEGLIELDGQSIQLTALGWYFVRGVAMTFDRYVHADQSRARFSRII